jgi:PPOX class probable F420-dependent enzyme
VLVVLDPVDAHGSPSEAPDGRPGKMQFVHEAEQRRRVTAARVGRLATLAPDGPPRLVPVCFVLDGDTVYSAVDRKPKRTARLQRLADVQARPVATLLVDEYVEDWSRLWWVRLRGRARVLHRGEERERALALLREKYAQYVAEAPDGAVLALDVEEWRGWSATP